MRNLEDRMQDLLPEINSNAKAMAVIDHIGCEDPRAMIAVGEGLAMMAELFAGHDTPAESIAYAVRCLGVLAISEGLNVDVATIWAHKMSKDADQQRKN